MTNLFRAGLVLLALGTLLACEGSPDIDRAAYEREAQAYSVEILRDPFGVPYIYGPRNADVAFGLGYANAEDDFKTIQETVWAVRGRLGERQGRDAAVLDYIVSLTRIWETVHAKINSDEVSDDARAVAKAYADAVNLYAARHPEQVWAETLPITAEDIFAGILFKQPLFFRIDTELLSLIEADEDDDKTAMAEGAQKLASRLTGVPMGSNAMAVAAPRSEDGHTRLFVNSHQPFEGPVAWYEARLKSGEGIDLIGGTFPGFPMIGHGVGPNLGWAFTVNVPDLVDIYELTINPDNEDQYELDGEWVDFEKSEARLRVKILGPIKWTVKQEVLWSKHGPALRTEKGVYAVRYPGMDDMRSLDQYIAMNSAQTYGEWLDAMRIAAVPSFNAIYADKTGTIAYHHNSRMPKRKSEAGIDWTGTVPGNRSDLIWQGDYGFDAVPKVERPASGYVFSSNNTPFTATDGPDNARIEDMPDTQAFEMHMTNRAHRQLETYGADPSITREEFIAYKFDLCFSKKSQLADQIQKIINAEFDDPDLIKGQKMLAEWDMCTQKTNTAAALAVYSILDIIRAEVKLKPWPDIIDGYKKAVPYLIKHFGKLDVEWQVVMRIIRGETDMGLDGGPDILRAIYDTDGPRDDHRLHAVVGDTLIQLADWDTDGALNLVTIHQFGSASQVPGSPHYDDQVPLFVDHKFKPTYLDRDDIEAAASRVYEPVKAE